MSSPNIDINDDTLIDSNGGSIPEQFTAIRKRVNRNTIILIVLIIYNALLTASMGWLFNEFFKHLMGR